MHVNLTCPQCGVLFVRTHNRQRYCTPTCKRAHEAIANRKPRRTMADRFWSHVDRSGGPDACWPWLAARTERGYGLFGLGGRNGHQTTAHRVALALHRGVPVENIDRGCHRCDNPPCCNPAHLFDGTQADNLEDMRQKGRRGRTGPKGSGALTEQAVREIRALWAGRNWTQTALAARYGVDQTSISRVVLRQSWRHVTDDPSN